MTNELPRTLDSLPIALIRAREALMGPVREMLATTSLSEQQWRIMRVLDEGGPMEAKPIAMGAAVSSPSLSRMLPVLEDRGFVVRKNHPKDRRRQVIEITGAGLTLINENRATAQSIAMDYRAKLGEEKYIYLIELLSEISGWKDTH